MTAKEFAKQMLTELADPHGKQRTRDAAIRRDTARRIAAAIEEIDTGTVATAKHMQELAVEAALSEGASL
jgi:hypothetical protein